MAKKRSVQADLVRPFAGQPFAFVGHTHEFYPNTVADLTERDAIEGNLRYEGVIVYVKSDNTTYQLRGGYENTDWVTLVSAGGASSHLDLTNIGTNTHVQIDDHIADVTLHFTVASISITESQINDLGSYSVTSHDHDATYLAIAAAAASSSALESATTTIDVSAAVAPIAGQVLTAIDGTSASWQNAAGGGGSGDIVQTGSPLDTHIAYFTADKNLSGDAGFTWITASARMNISGTTPSLRIQDTDSAHAAMQATLDFYDSTILAAQVGFLAPGGIFTISNVSGAISLAADVSTTGYLTGYAGVPTDTQILRWVTANGRAEFQSFNGVTAAGTPVDSQIAVWTTANIIEGAATFTWDGTVFTAENFIYTSTTDKVTIGDGTLSGPGITIDASATGNPSINLQQGGSTVAIWKFDDTANRMELSSLADDITLRPGNVDTLTLTGTVLTMSGAVLADTVQLSGGTGTQGTFSWNADEETADLILDGAVLQLGQEMHINVKNNSGALISNGTPVMATGTLGASSRITVSPMDGTTVSNAKFMIGIATEDIADAADGKITSFGKVRGIDTTGTPYTETWADGDVIWLSDTTAGDLTNVEPTTPAIGMPVAIVVYAHATVGSLFIRVTPIDEHHFIHVDGGQTITGTLHLTGNFTTDALIDGRDVLADGTALDTHIADTSIHGDVFKVGTPANNQLAVWTGDGTLEGESRLTYAYASSGALIHTDANPFTITAPVGLILNAFRISQQNSTVGWHTDHRVFEQHLGHTGWTVVGSTIGSYHIGHNNYDDGSGLSSTPKYIQAGTAGQLVFNGGNLSFDRAVSGAIDGAITWLQVFDQSGDLWQHYAKMQLMPSTTVRAGLQLLEGVAPTTPLDGDVWVTAAGEYFAQLNGVSVDLSTDTDTVPTVTKVGAPANNQLAVWTGNGTLEAESNLTYTYVGVGVLTHTDTNPFGISSATGAAFLCNHVGLGQFHHSGWHDDHTTVDIPSNGSLHRTSFGSTVGAFHLSHNLYDQGPWSAPDIRRTQLGSVGRLRFIGSDLSYDYGVSGSGGTAVTLLPVFSTSFDIFRTHGPFTAEGKITNTGGAKLEVQKGVDGGPDYGIAMWLAGDTGWAIYMGQSGGTKSYNGAAACTSLDARTGHHIRQRVSNGPTQGFIWENTAEQCLMSLAGDDGELNTLDLSVTGAIAVTGTVDGRDIATDGAKLDGIEALASATALSIGTQTSTTFGVTSENAADDVIIPEAVGAADGNAFSYSEDITNSFWQIGGSVTKTGDQAYAPDGTFTADQVSLDALASHTFWRYFYPVTIGDVTTVSGYFKKDTYNLIGIRVGGTGTHITFDLDTELWTNTSGFDNWGAVNVGDGWYRLWATATMPATGSLVHGFCLPNTAGAEIWSAAGTESAYVWGATLTDTDYLPLYVKTVASPVAATAGTRTAGLLSTSKLAEINDHTAHLTDSSIHTEDALLAHLAGTETFTGTKTFAEDATFSKTAIISGATPDLLITETDSTTDEKNWDISAQGGILTVRLLNDALDTAVDAISVTRNGMAVSSINLKDNVSVTGDITVSGTVDGRDVAVDGAAWDATHLGIVGADGLDSVTDTEAEWANVPIGYSRMISSTIGTAGGAPVNNFGYFTKSANRDTAGGWGGIWTGYASNQHYMGRAATSASFATWEQLITNVGGQTIPDITITNNLTVGGTVDGRDVATDGTKLDTIATSANLYTHPNHSGDVTSVAGGAQTIGAKKVTLAMMADGTDGELITYSATGVAAKVAVGTSTHVLTSNGVGVAPTFQANGGGLSADSVGTVEIANSVTTAAGNVNSGVHVSLTLNDWALMPMIHSTQGQKKVFLAGHISDGTSASNPRMGFINDGGSSDSYDMDHRYIIAA